MNIAFIDWFCNPRRPRYSGMSDIVWAIAERLAMLGDQVHVVAPYGPSPGFPVGVKVHQHGIPPMGYRNIVGNLMLSIMAWNEVRRIPSLDVVHAAEYLSTSILLLLKLRTPVVLTTPGNIYERIDNINHFDYTVTEVYKWAARLTAKKGTRIIATSESMANWWEFSGAPPLRIAKIPLGVDTRFFQPIPEARKVLNLDSKPNILFVGRLQSENGLYYLLEAMVKVIKELPGARLDIVGDGPDKNRMINLVSKLGLKDYIRWHGNVPFETLPLYYSACDVFALPRLSRVTPRVLFEAMACRTVVITSEIGGIVDFVQDGITGFLIPPYDSNLLAFRILQVLRNEIHSVGIADAAHEFAVRNLDWDIIVHRLRTEVYETLP